MADDKEQGRSFYPLSVSTRHDYGASGIRWCRIANLNGTVEIKSLVSNKIFKVNVNYIVGVVRP